MLHKNFRKLLIFFIIWAALWFIISPLALASSIEYIITDLGETRGWSPSINDSGNVVGYRYFSPSEYHAFLYQQGTFIDLTEIQPFNPSDVNNSGQVIGSRDGDILLYENGSIEDLPFPSGGHYSAQAINDSGVIVGVNNQPAAGGFEPFLYDHGIYTNIGEITQSGGVATDINNQGQVVGYGDSLSRSWIYEDGNITDYITDCITDCIESPSNTQATAINNFGQVAGSTDPPAAGWYAFIYQDGTMSNIDTLGSYESKGLGLNDLGQVVGVFTDPLIQYSHGFIYEDGIMVDLNDLIVGDSGFDYLGWAYDINNKGQIVGTGPINGETHIYLATPVPIPSAVWLLAPSLIGLVVFGRKPKN